MEPPSCFNWKYSCKTLQRAQEGRQAGKAGKQGKMSTFPEFTLANLVAHFHGIKHVTYNLKTVR
jgi:hypothetical protein